MSALKIKYFVFGSRDPNTGAAKKMFSQVSELNRLGLDTELVWVSMEDFHFPYYDFLTLHRVDRVLIGDYLGRIKRARKISKIFGEVIDSLESDDILYCRYNSLPLYYPHQYFRRLRSCKIVTEHQTKELDESKLVGNTLAFWSDYIFGKLLRKQSDAIVGVTNEITHHEIARAGDSEKHHTTIGNGFVVRSAPLRRAPQYNNDLSLLCVASMINHWHGFDRLLQGLAAYNGMPRVVIHVVGGEPGLPHLQKLASDLGITDRVIFHGFLTGEFFDALFDQCHIAVGSLGIHRKGLTQTSELKAREYCARGIPYIIACADPDFPTDFPYILRLPADESPIDIEQVLAFAEEVCADPDHPQKMRRYAEEHLDWSVKMAKLKEFLEALVGEGAGIPEPGPASPGDDGPEVPKGATLPGPIATRVPGKGE